MRNLVSRHREFIGHVALLMSGRTVAALVALVTTPIVARLFTPADFGVAAVFVSIISVVAQVASLRYEAAICLPKEQDEALALMALAYRIAFAVSAALLLLIGLYQVAGWHWPTLELLGVWIWLVPPGILLAGALHIQESWLIRGKAFGRTSASMLTANAVTSGSRIGIGAWLGSSVWGLISTQLLGMLAQFLVQNRGTGGSWRVALRRFDRRVMRDLARRYADFPRLNAPAGLVFSLGSNLPVLLFGVLFSPAIAGFYAMAHRLSQVPLGIVAQSLRKVYLQKAAAIRNQGISLQRSFRLVIAGMTVIGAPPLIVLWLYGQPLLTLLLGERWLTAGHFLELMAPWLLSVWIAAPCNAVFIVLREQRFFLARQAALTVARLVGLIVAYAATKDVEWTLGTFVLVTVIANVVTIRQTIQLIKKHANGRGNG